MDDSILLDGKGNIQRVQKMPDDNNQQRLSPDNFRIV